MEHRNRFRLTGIPVAILILLFVCTLTDVAAGPYAASPPPSCGGRLSGRRVRALLGLLLFAISMGT